MTDTHVQVAWGSCSDRGLRRAVNEDSFIADSPLFLVADGMGGHEGGALASRSALDAFRPLIGQSTVTVEQVHDAFARAVSGVGAIESTRNAPGTTLTGAAICEQGGATYWLILNIGDSRTYRLSRGLLAQISVDHSAVQALVERGEIDAKDAERHPHRNVVTRAVGAGSRDAPDYWLEPAQSGERLLVCSDGLTKELSDAQIADVLREERSPQAAATRLVHEALLRGGHDNVTVIVVDAERVAEIDDDPTVPGIDVDEDTHPVGWGGDRVAQV